jgi:hypothetical protein
MIMCEKSEMFFWREYKAVLLKESMIGFTERSEFEF